MQSKKGEPEVKSDQPTPVRLATTDTAVRNGNEPFSVLWYLNGGR
jgi:hypothetical protein